MTVVTRFAPSPTGYLHLGGARTALFNFLYAKNKNGVFKIRIEDTDLSRNINQMSSKIIEDLKWLGIITNDKVEMQSQNMSAHKEFANSLLNKGLAYKCFEETDFKSESFLKKNKKSIWRDVQSNHPSKKKFCIRIKSPNSGKTSVVDKIQGKIEIDNSELDDFIILRTNQTPTFLLSSVIDDFNMKVTDILRGDDHLTNTLRQKVLFDYLNYQPNFAHISLIHNYDNKKLSKRDSVLTINDYKNKGYLKESIINYILRMGWSYGDKEFFSLREAISLFNLENIGKSPAKIDDTKLNFLNNHYIKNLENDELVKRLNCLDELQEKYKINNYLQKSSDFIGLFKDRCYNLEELKETLKILFNFQYSKNEDNQKVFNDLKKHNERIYDSFFNLDDWSESSLSLKIKNLVAELDINFKKLGQPLRMAVIGKVNGPSISSIFSILGKREVLKRLEKVFYEK